MTIRKPEVFCWNRPEGFPDPTGAILLTVRRDEKVKRTLYEAHLPLSALGVTGQSIFAGFRFNLILNDNDGEFREGLSRRQSRNGNRRGSRSLGNRQS